MCSKCNIRSQLCAKCNIRSQLLLPVLMQTTYQSLNQSWTWCEKWLLEGKKFHTIGIAAVCWSIWKTRNKCCFEDKIIKNPISVVCYACALMCSWAGLYSAEDEEMLLAGVNTMMQIARKLLNKRSEQSVGDLKWLYSDVLLMWNLIFLKQSDRSFFCFLFYWYFCYQLSRLAAKTVMVVAWSNFTLAVKRILDSWLVAPSTTLVFLQVSLACFFWNVMWMMYFRYFFDGNGGSPSVQKKKKEEEAMLRIIMACI